MQETGTAWRYDLGATPEARFSISTSRSAAHAAAPSRSSACIEDLVVIRKILDLLKDMVNTRIRFGYPRAATRHKRAYLTKENPFMSHKEVAGDARQGSRSAAGSDGADHRAEIQSMPQVEPPHLLRLSTSGREIAELTRVVGIVSQEKGVYTSYTLPSPA